MTNLSLSQFDYPRHQAVDNCIRDGRAALFDSSYQDWEEWRLCYQAGRHFRNRCLVQFEDAGETTAEFETRKSLTPIPAYAKRQVNRVKNAIAQRIGDVTRSGGSSDWKKAVAGEGLGVDRRGSSMNGFLTKRLLAELLILGEVGVLVTAPEIPLPENGVISQADVPSNFRPYFLEYKRESYPLLIHADSHSPSDYSHVLLKDCTTNYTKGGGEETITTWRHFFLDARRTDDEGNPLVTVVVLTDRGEPEREIQTQLNAIPFVVFDIGGSLIEDACSYQVALMNMMSADSNYAINSNFPFLTRQRGNDDGGDHFTGGTADKEITPGRSRGLWYEKGRDRPDFISPPAEPMRASLDLRKEMKQEVEDIVMGAISDLGADGSVDSGLSFIGKVCLEVSERRLWDHWAGYESVRMTNRKQPLVEYPKSWTVKTDAERLEEANAVLKLANEIVGRKPKQEAAKLAVLKMFAGIADDKTISAMQSEIDNLALPVSDANTIIQAKDKGILSVETAATALGAMEGEGERAMADAAERAKMVVAAQSDSQGGDDNDGAANGNPDGSVDPSSTATAQEDDGAGSLRERGSNEDRGSEEDEEA